MAMRRTTDIVAFPSNVATLAQHRQSADYNARRVHTAINSSSNGHSYLHRASARFIREQFRASTRPKLTRGRDDNRELDYARAGCSAISAVDAIDFI